VQCGGLTGWGSDGTMPVSTMRWVLPSEMFGRSAAN
jgi:hypothetical protein